MKDDDSDDEDEILFFSGTSIVTEDGLTACVFILLFNRTAVAQGVQRGMK